MTQEKSTDSAMSSDWQPIVSGNAQLKLSSTPAGRLPALQMDFDFKGGGGFVVARRVLKQRMPEEYAVSFRLRGRGAEGLGLERAAGIPTLRRLVRLRLETPAGRSAAMDRDRFERAPRHRRLDRRLAGAGAGRRLSCPQLEQRRPLENRVCGEGSRRQTQLCVSARAQDPISPPGARRAVGGCGSAGAILRVLAFHSCLLEQRRERRSARLASALAAQ